MFNHRIAHLASALLVFIQQLAHLLDRERRILSVERFLTLALVQKRPVPCIRADGNLLVGLPSVADAARILICVGESRISHCLLRESDARVASAVESLRIELPRQEGIYPPKTLRIGFFLDIKRTDGGLLIDRYSIGDEFFVLCVILQVHVRPEQAIHQLSLLVLSSYGGESSHEQHTGGDRFSHTARLPESGATCKGNLLLSRQAETPACPTDKMSVLLSRGLFIVFHYEARNNERMPDHVYKKIEIVGSSPNGFEEAVQNALARAEKTVRSMRWFEVTETRGTIEEGKVGEWQVTLKIGFTLEE